MALNKINNFYNEVIYIDSNIFLYALNKRHEFSNDCAKFLLKIDGGDILGFTSVNCLNEVIPQNDIL